MNKAAIGRRFPLLRFAVRYVTNLSSTVAGFLYDFRRYVRHSPLAGPPRSAAHFEALLTLDYHSLEKGMALREPRPGFGQRRINSIITLMRSYAQRFGWGPAAHVAVKVLKEYQSTQEPAFKSPQIERFLANLPDPGDRCGGTYTLTREQVLEHARLDLKEFFASRSSVRHFSSEPVDLSLIQEAVEMARKTPSVCNRQPWRVYVLTKREQIDRALRHQNGNGGFGDQVDKLLIIATDLRRFTTAGERFQCWIDGGMFSMSIVYALHSLGLGTCCLNMSTTAKRDRALRADVPVKSHETVIMMLAVGHLPEKFRVAQSPKRPLSDILEIL